MTKRFFYSLSLLVFCSLLWACPGARETNVSVNSSNAASPSAEREQKPADKTEAGKSSENTNSAGKTEKKENFPADSVNTPTGGKFENRCGWFVNPTPANAWLNDKDGEWTVSVQGGYQAEGDWGDFPDDRWVKTNGNYGYGCACMKVRVDFEEKRILKIADWTTKPLSACRNDAALKEPKE